jgi:hypothetical protein
MSEEQSEYVGGLLLIGFMLRLYEEYVDSSVLWLLKKKKKKKKTDRRDIIAKLVGRSGSKLPDMDRSYTVKKSSSLKEEDNDDDDDDDEEEEESHLSVD